MKSFKKVLCLVLVVVMALGVSTVAFAGNLDKFNDADKAVAPYAEAVDVLVGLKVVNGVSTTELALDQSYTREQAAKVIAYLLLGQKAADALSADSAPFADVEASRWSAGYIAFCVKQGIIAGYDATTFGPTDGLTGYQFAKMLLTAVGYGKNGEYVGEGWSINVAKDALALGIFEGDLAAATNAVVSRKQAMLLAFNTLVNVPTVNYNSNFETYYTGGNFTNGIWKVESYVRGDDGYSQTLGWTVFGLESEKTDDYENADFDGYGRMFHNWTINSGRTTISDDHTETPAYTFTGKLTEKALYEALGKTVAGYEIWACVDGEWSGSAITLDKTSTTAVAGTGASSSIEVYVYDEWNYVDVIVINNYFAEVTDVDEDKETATFTVYLKDVDVDDNPIAVGVEDLVFDTTDFEEDDYAVVNMYYDVDEWVIDKAVAAEKVAAAGVTTTSANYIKVGSTTYNKAVKLIAENVNFAAGSKYDLYLDNFGNVIGSVSYSEPAADLNYLYVNDSASKPYGAIAGNAYVKIAADFADGTSKVVNLLVKKSTTDEATYNNGSGTVDVYDSSEDGAEPPVENDFYSYTVNSDGFYTIKALDPENTGTGTSISYNKGSAKITIDTELTATSSTKMVLVDDGTTYTGYSKFPSADTFDEADNILYILKSGKLATIYIFGESSVKLAPVFGWFDGEVERDEDYVTYKVFVDGDYEKYTVKIEDADDDLSNGDIVTVEVDTKGYAKIELLTNADPDYDIIDAVEVESVDAGSYFEAGDTVYYFGDDDNDCTIANATKSTLTAASSVKAGQYVIIVIDDEVLNDGGYTALAVYIVNAPAP